MFLKENLDRKENSRSLPSLLAVNVNLSWMVLKFPSSTLTMCLTLIDMSTFA